MRCVRPLALAAICLATLPSSGASWAQVQRRQEAKAPAAPPAPSINAAALVKEADGLYRQGAYAEAVKRYQPVIDAGKATGAVLYRAGMCYGMGLNDKTKEQDLKQRAVPLLEKEVASGASPVDAYYYLAAIHYNDLHDPVKGNEYVAKGVAALEAPGTAPPATQEQLFRAGRLYSFAAKEDKAVAYYEKSARAAEAAGAEVERPSLMSALESAADFRFRAKSWDAAAQALGGILKLDPSRSKERHQLGLALLRAGKPAEAAEAWRQPYGNDELRTELTYLSTIARKYADAGAPKTTKIAPKPSSLDDKALREKILQAAEPLRALRQKETEARKAKEEKERSEAASDADKPGYVPPSTPPQRVLVKGKNKGKAKKWQGPEDPLEELKRMGLAPASLPPAQAVSPERLALEKELFALMAEYVARGHLVRNFCFENGLVELLFR